MKPETKKIKELDRQEREKITQEARKIAYDFKRWGFRLDIFPLHPYSGWAKMTPQQVYQPEIYALYLDDECIKDNMYITDLSKVYLAAKRYRHDNGIKKLQENIEDILK